MAAAENIAGPGQQGTTVDLDLAVLTTSTDLKVSECFPTEFRGFMMLLGCCIF
jgi:hypothetical protein